jgi:hypothetical protein
LNVVEAVLPVGQEVALNLNLFILEKPRLKPRIWDSLLDLNCQRSIEERAHLYKRNVPDDSSVRLSKVNTIFQD